jgi:uncharacterized protein YjdB
VVLVLLLILALQQLQCLVAQTVSGTNTVCMEIQPHSLVLRQELWSSTTPTVATVDSATGVVTGAAAGTRVINYSNHYRWLCQYSF